MTDKALCHKWEEGRSKPCPYEQIRRVENSYWHFEFEVKSKTSYLGGTRCTTSWKKDSQKVMIWRFHGLNTGDQEFSHNEIVFSVMIHIVISMKEDGCSKRHLRRPSMSNMSWIQRSETCREYSIVCKEFGGQVWDCTDLAWAQTTRGSWIWIRKVWVTVNLNINQHFINQ